QRGITQKWIPRAETSGNQDLVARVLAARGIDKGESSIAFLKPSLAGLHDPSLIPDLDKAAERILLAITNNEKITIFGDYDVDGITATTILVQLIRTIAPDTNLATYIPHRIDEGYGLNTDAIRSFADDGTNVIITVDCGITANAPAALAKELAMDLIITDHHNPPSTVEEMPDAFAVVHPRRPDSQYPFGELCGAGVAHKLAWRLATMHANSERVSEKSRGVLLDLLAFAALGTIADIVPLVDENRIIVKHGLGRILHVRNEGLHALIHASGLDSGGIDTEAVGFRLAPRLNAVGRLGHASESLELLTNATGAEAEKIAEGLTLINEQRRAQEQKILAQAIEMVESQNMTSPDTRAIVLASKDWHPGIVGIVCSRLVDRFGRPTILMCIDGEKCRGSGRSIKGFNLHGGLEECKEHLSTFGGHDMAAGMACGVDQFEAFQTAFTDHANAKLSPDDLIRSTTYDTAARLDELTASAIGQLDRLAPFGAGNPRIRVRLTNLRINGSPEQFGKTGNHMALRVADASKGGATIRIIGWNWWRHASAIPHGATIEAVVEPKVSTWNGNTRIEPVLVDACVVVDGVASDYSVTVSTAANRPALN
ncbi:MAG: single-stranded-DNA-specific exonuclease RecJ, partial [Phycisphaerales bacterium]|nr:single-stranded-DNA-specific exonuclease RecJ [Phycisphaerales bacterium]